MKSDTTTYPSLEHWYWVILAVVIGGLVITGTAFADSHIGADGVAHYGATLSGDEEVPPVTTAATGTLALTIHATSTDTTATTTIGVFDLDVFNGTGITAAHLHCAPDGENGPVVVPLFEAGAATTSATTTTATSTDVSGDLSAGTTTDDHVVGTGCDPAITTMAGVQDAIDAGEIYVNVHSTSSPAGLIRGQVEAVPQEDDDDENGDENGENGNGASDDLGEFIRSHVRERLDAIRTRLEMRLDAIEERIDRIRFRLNVE